MTDKVEQPHYHIHTDGSALGNPGPGGYGIVARCGDTKVTLSKGYFKTTNNRQELMAVVVALEEFGPGIKVTIYTDSQYAINCATKWMRSWARNKWVTYQTQQPVKNKDILMVLAELMKVNKVNFVKVRAHSGVPDNEEADQLARNAAANPEVQDVEYMKQIGI